MERKFRLTSATDFRRVRRTGNTYAHPLVLLIVSESGSGVTRIGVTAGRAVGGAVSRNRARRRIRAALQRRQPELELGWDLVVVARSGLVKAPWSELLGAIDGLLKVAGVLRNSK